jgi:hypothetical protein
MRSFRGVILVSDFSKRVQDFQVANPLAVLHVFRKKNRCPACESGGNDQAIVESEPKLFLNR